ncbi:heavy metal sensor histidine kinase [Ramlibacter sp.]|uniref:heavy metal sensor histidine kinase n=1 Tax=Ramlibacter sp. TaxID=1917967 RepID=UPI002605B7B6|nr:heavy metal sensor histidine kinase [Ramlibacter sp.]MDB5953449.1 heavy metal sensor signal transduction histidine kinase [Ramlibacter sp.]
MKGSITWRLACMYAVVAFVTFAVMGAALYMVLQTELVRREDDQLTTYSQGLQYSIERSGTLERWARVTAKMDTLTPADGSVRFWVLSPDPRFGYGRGARDVAAQIRADGSDRVSDSGIGYRTLARTIGPLEERPPVRLVVGVNKRFFERTLATFAAAYSLLALVATLVAAGMGFWIGRVGLRPVRQLSRDAQALQPNRSAQRLAAGALPVELRDLAGAFNGALERLENAYQQLEGFNADVAHELRTPLANLIGATQVVLSRPRNAVQFQEVLQSNLEELERLRSIVNDMLFLARADQGEVATALAECIVAGEVRKTLDFFEFLLDEKNIVVTVEGELDVTATMERALFRRALSNLVQNGITHSRPGARLVVSIRTDERFVWVAISNAGEAIAQAHLQRLFDRFYRVDVARNDGQSEHGFGLGLAIVKAIARMHGGRVTARSDNGVTTIGFSLLRTATQT